MRNLRMIIEYDGTDFYGWQYQPDKRTVQGEIEKAIEKITGQNIRIIGAGRTDQGVHALAQVANFKTESNIPPEKFKKALNSLIGEDIHLREMSEVPLDFHARFSAKSKIYQYKIMTQFSPLKRRTYWLVEYELNIGRMRKVAALLIGEHDFKNISAHDEESTPANQPSPIDSENDHKNTICKIYDLSLTIDDFDIIITIEANRFLRKMARGLVGFLVDVGRERYHPEDAMQIFSGALRGIYFAPPQGLCLMEVKY
ncbi:MAG: tRNA pseudouridine(38-40) synthase TruA [bacterium]